MQPGALAGQQVAVDGLLQQGVPERVAAGRVGEQQLPADRLAQRLVERLLVEPGGRRQQLVVDPATGHARHPYDVLCGRRELLDPAEQDVGELARHLGRGLGGGGQQLLGEEGVALGPLEQVGQAGLRDRVPR